MLNLEPRHYPGAHSGHDCLILSSYVFNMSPEGIMDISNWGSVDVMKHYVAGPKCDGLNVKMVKYTVPELDEKVEYLLNYVVDRDIPLQSMDFAEG